MTSSPAPKNDNITYSDNHLDNLHSQVATHLNSAGVKTPYVAVKPSHVPDELPRNIIDEKRIQAERSVPESFNSTPETALSPLGTLSEGLDYADQLVTGRSHVTGEASRFTGYRKEKEEKAMKFNNTKHKSTHGPVKKLVDWLHD